MTHFSIVSVPVTALKLHSSKSATTSSSLHTIFTVHSHPSLVWLLTPSPTPSSYKDFYLLALSTLSYFKSYLSGCTQFIQLSSYWSQPSLVTSGVAQGSILDLLLFVTLAPLLFVTYLFPLGDIFHKFNIHFHCYADDAQLYLSTKTNSTLQLPSLTSCLFTLKSWSFSNSIEFNDNKTDVLLICTKSDHSKGNSLTLSTSNSSVSPTPHVKSLGVILDSSLSFHAP